VLLYADLFIEGKFGQEPHRSMLGMSAAPSPPTPRNFRSSDGPLDRAVRAVALRHEPVQDGSNSFYVQPASVGHIRKFLFGLLGGTPQEAALAKSCLMAIDVLRDENGIAANDTRHPDVLSEIPWPPEAAQPAPRR
jgi:hypothetical protein